MFSNSNSSILFLRVACLAIRTVHGHGPLLVWFGWGTVNQFFFSSRQHSANMHERYFLLELRASLTDVKKKKLLPPAQFIVPRASSKPNLQINPNSSKTLQIWLDSKIQTCRPSSARDSRRPPTIPVVVAVREAEADQEGSSSGRGGGQSPAVRPRTQSPAAALDPHASPRLPAATLDPSLRRRPRGRRRPLPVVIPGAPSSPVVLPCLGSFLEPHPPLRRPACFVAVPGLRSTTPTVPLPYLRLLQNEVTGQE